MDISIKQLDYMKHAIGLRKDRIKRHKYEYFRNYYSLSVICPVWEDLVSKGFAYSRGNESHYSEGGKVYSVTRKGMDLLEELTMVKITQRD